MCFISRHSAGAAVLIFRRAAKNCCLPVRKAQSWSMPAPAKNSGGLSHKFRKVNSMYHVAYSPTSSLIALANDEGEITLWDAESGKLMQNIIADKIPLESFDNSLVIAPDNKRLFCG